MLDQRLSAWRRSAPNRMGRAMSGPPDVHGMLDARGAGLRGARPHPFRVDAAVGGGGRGAHGSPIHEPSLSVHACTDVGPAAPAFGELASRRGGSSTCADDPKKTSPAEIFRIEPSSRRR